MALSQGRSKRKASGGRYWPFRKKKARELGTDARPTTVGPTKVTVKRVLGGNIIHKMDHAQYANIPGKKVKIKLVRENAASRHFVRQNVVTKGAIIETEAGLARVTNRPTKDGMVNAVLVKQ